LTLALVGSGLLALLNTTVIGAVLPAMIADLDMAPANAHWVSTGYLLAAGVAIPLGGWASLRFGLRSTWLVAMVIFTIGSAGSGFAGDGASVIAFRIVQGFGGGMLEPLMLTAMAVAAGPQKVGRVMGAVSAVMSLGPLAGPALGGLAVETLGWQAPLIASFASGVLLLVGGWASLGREKGSTISLDVPGLILVSVATTTGLWGLTEFASSEPTYLFAAGAILIAAIALLLFINRARVLGSMAFVDLTLFAVPGFGMAVFIMSMVGLAVYPLFFGLPQFYQSVAGLEPSVSGLLMVPYGLGTLVVMPFAGWLNDRVPARIIVPFGAGIAIVAFSILLWLGTAMAWQGYALLSLGIGLGLGSIGSPTVASLYRALPATATPAGSTILFVCMQLGGALGVAMLVVLMGSSEWPADIGTLPFIAPIVALAVIAIASQRLGR